MAADNGKEGMYAITKHTLFHGSFLDLLYRARICASKYGQNFLLTWRQRRTSTNNNAIIAEILRLRKERGRLDGFMATTQSGGFKTAWPRTPENAMKPDGSRLEGIHRTRLPKRYQTCKPLADEEGAGHYH